MDFHTCGLPPPSVGLSPFGYTTRPASLFRRFHARPLAQIHSPRSNSSLSLVTTKMFLKQFDSYGNIRFSAFLSLLCP